MARLGLDKTGVIKKLRSCIQVTFRDKVRLIGYLKTVSQSAQKVSSQKPEELRGHLRTLFTRNMSNNGIARLSHKY